MTLDRAWRQAASVWRESGVIVSTNHTVRRDDDITVALEDGKTATAKLVGRDSGTDLAVSKTTRLHKLFNTL